MHELWTSLSPFLVSGLVLAVVMQIAENIMLCFTGEEDDDE